MLTALALGGAEGVLDEAYDVLPMFGPDGPDAIAVCNDTFAIWPHRVDYFCTLHCEKVDDWIAQREANGYPMGAEVWSHTRNFGHNGKQVYKNITKLASCWGMSSGGYNVRVLLQEGFDRIVICGTPMEPKVHHITRRDKSGNPVPWIEANDFWDNWKERFFEMKDTVRSTSGRSQRLLGAPTEKWIRGESEPLTVYGASIRPRKA